MDMYHIHTQGHGISMVVGGNSHRHAALIVAEVIAKSDPPGAGGVCCVKKLSGPEGGGSGYYAAMVGAERWYHIAPRKIRPLSSQEKKARTYIDDGGIKCPFCGSSNIEAVQTTSYYDHVLEAICLDCNKEWEDSYTLTEVKLYP